MNLLLHNPLTTILLKKAVDGFSVSAKNLSPQVDWLFVMLWLLLVSVGLVFGASASVAIAESMTGNPLYYLQKDLIFLAVGGMAALITLMIPMSVWKDYSHWVLILALGLLVLVLLPGVGVSVNGSQRWLNLGLFNFQVSEFAKLAMLTFMASYLVRQGEQLRASWAGFGKPMIILGTVLMLLLLEPDFGSAVVLSGTVLAVLFLAGVSLWRFILTLCVSILLLGYLATSSDYRMQRILSFMDPWADQFNTGYQLTQALIAFGRGEWFGVGLGNSLQKLFYLPEAHTDFVFAVIAEEAGLVGAVLLIGLLWTLGQRILRIGRRCIVEGQGNEVMQYAGYLVSGIGLLFLFQCFINIGVSCGLLPTKGLTLPFVSYGGSSILVWSTLMSMVLRADWELRQMSCSEVKQ
ncbi:MAG: putative lipid II flippase FtsW [Porticoccaceae bacterium]